MNFDRELEEKHYLNLKQKPFKSEAIAPNKSHDNSIIMNTSQC